jgi:hypothetical protein
MAKFPLYQMKNSQAHISENHKSRAMLCVHALKNPAQKAKNQKMKVTKTQGRKFIGMLKVAGLKAAAPKATVEKTPNHFTRWRMKVMDFPSVIDLGS